MILLLLTKLHIIVYDVLHVVDISVYVVLVDISVYVVPYSRYQCVCCTI